MPANKRPPRGSGDRPIIRSSHGGPRPQAGKSPPRAKAPERPTKTKLTKALAKAGGPASRRGGGDDEVKTKKAKASEPAALRGVSTASDEARELAVLIAVAAIEKKASGLELIDVAGKVDYADFLVLMSGRSDRHVTALANAIEEALRTKNKRALAVEGLPHANWVLMDFGDVVVHVFQDDARATYDIDALWMDARRVPVPLPDTPHS